MGADAEPRDRSDLVWHREGIVAHASRVGSIVPTYLQHAPLRQAHQDQCVVYEEALTADAVGAIEPWRNTVALAEPARATQVHGLISCAVALLLSRPPALTERDTQQYLDETHCRVGLAQGAGRLRHLVAPFPRGKHRLQR